MKYFYCLALILLSFQGCRLLEIPKKPFDASSPPTQPDYGQYENWAALPFKKDLADTVPPGYGLADSQSVAGADVFYIHPTSYSRARWNAETDHPRTIEKTDHGAILHQASAFNGTARVFAPRYRQMTYWGFFAKDTSSKRDAIALAYEDVYGAFQYYLEHWNKGRPFFVVGHSQGALHGMHLLAEIYSNEKLKGQLVAAYLPGWRIDRSFRQSVPICQDPEEFGCLVSWCSYADGKRLKGRSADYYENAICVNPINWSASGDWTRYDQHKGVLNGDYDQITDSLVRAGCVNGILRVTTDRLPFPYKWITNFHVADMNLFWMDIRENVALRWQQYQMERED